MRDQIDLGSTPCNEPCAQVGQEGYDLIGRQECKRYIDLIRKTIGDEPPGAKLAVKGNHHDFGTYYEVVCYFDTDNEESVKYAYNCENNAPTNWPKDPSMLESIKTKFGLLRQLRRTNELNLTSEEIDYVLAILDNIVD